MHSDVFVKSDDWLDPFLERMAEPDVAGAWKLNLENPIYALQKRVLGAVVVSVKVLLGKKERVVWRKGHFPRDYCAMYRREPILRHDLTFRSLCDMGGGYSIAKQLWDAGYQTAMIPVSQLARRIVHVAHGTAAIAAEKPLHHKREQLKVERKVLELFSESWVKSLQNDVSLDE